MICVKSLRYSPFRSTLNASYSYIKGSDMCEVCTESSPFRSNFECVNYVPKQSIP